MERLEEVRGQRNGLLYTLNKYKDVKEELSYYRKQCETREHVIERQGSDIDRVLDEADEWKQQCATLKKACALLKEDAKNDRKVIDEYKITITSSANDVALWQKDNKRLQELVRTLQAEKEEQKDVVKALKDDIKISEEKYNADKCQKVKLCEDIDALKAKLPPDENERPPLKRRPGERKRPRIRHNAQTLAVNLAEERGNAKARRLTKPQSHSRTQGRHRARDPSRGRRRPTIPRIVRLASKP